MRFAILVRFGGTIQYVIRQRRFRWCSPDLKRALTWSTRANAQKWLDRTNAALIPSCHVAGLIVESK